MVFEPGNIPRMTQPVLFGMLGARDDGTWICFFDDRSRPALSEPLSPFSFAKRLDIQGNAGIYCFRPGGYPRPIFSASVF